MGRISRPVDKRIVYTRHDGGLDINCPTPEIFEIMTGSGDPVWRFRQKLDRNFLDEQIARQIAAGIHKDHAHIFARAVMWGCRSEDEVWLTICARDCAQHGTGHELVYLEDIPRDRWFRNAWRQGHNGGIAVDIDKARPIQRAKIERVIGAENERRKLGDRRVLAPRWPSIDSLIARAGNVDQLKSIWPKGLEMAA